MDIVDIISVSLVASVLLGFVQELIHRKAREE